MTARWTVYLMSDPRPRGLTYVGCTVAPIANRRSQHMHDPCAASPVQIWVELLRRDGAEPSIESLYVVDDERTGLALERSTIHGLAATGVPLLNTRHAKPVNSPTVGHVRLLSFCRHDYRVFCKRVGRAFRFGNEVRALWLGHCPKLSNAIRLEEMFGVPLHDWLSPAEDSQRAA